MTAPQPPELQSPLAGGRFVELSGNRVHFLDLGAGTPVLMVHGMGASHHTWRRNLDALSPNFRLVVPDLPGYGLSIAADDFRFTVTEYTQMLEDLLTDLGIARVHIVAHSFGGAIAENLARSAPDRVGRMVLIGSSDLRCPILSSDSQKAKYLFLYSYHDKSAMDREAIEFGRRINRDGRIARTTRAVCEANLDGNRCDGRLDHPALIIWGRHDEIVSADGAPRLAERYRSADVRVIDAAGHACHEEKPDIIDGLIGGFLTAEN